MNNANQNQQPTPAAIAANNTKASTLFIAGSAAAAVVVNCDVNWIKRAHKEHNRSRRHYSWGTLMRPSSALLRTINTRVELLNNPASAQRAVA